MKNGRKERPERPRTRGGNHPQTRYLRTVKLVKEALRPVEPPPRLIIEIRNLGQALGSDDLLMDLARDSRKKRRGWIIGGICSTLSICGMASYALARYLMHREGIEADHGMMTPA